MKKIIYIIICIFASISANAQLKIEYSAGYGSYKMDDMKSQLTNIQTELKKQYPFDFAITDNFPSYVTHNLGVTYQLNKHEFGANLTYLTTAGRLAYSDYSGEIVDKLTLNAYRIGLLYRYHFYKIGISDKTNISFYGELSPAMTLTDLKTKGHIKVGNEQKDLDDKYKLDSDMTSFSVLPQLGINLNLPYGIGVHLSGGYDIDMGASMKQNKDAKVNWSGLRIGGGVSYKLPFKLR